MNTTEKTSKPLEIVKIWYSIQNGGDGSAYPSWFLSESEADQDQADMDEGWGESCTGSVQTFRGSDIHLKALIRSPTIKFLDSNGDDVVLDTDSAPMIGSPSRGHLAGKWVISFYKPEIPDGVHWEEIVWTGFDMAGIPEDERAYRVYG